MSDLKVSVVTPTRNRAALLEETLDSVAAQTFHEWEHIVVDDGSDDGTAELMARAAADPRVRYMVRDGDRARRQSLSQPRHPRGGRITRGEASGSDR
jgi:glycosyltransferase involved in cell wall biosynthesis